MKALIVVGVMLSLLIIPLPHNVVQAQSIIPTRILPPEVCHGSTFTVMVNFTAPADNFNSIGLTDTAPENWTVTANVIWSNPNASERKITNNTVEIMWNATFDNGTDFTAVYDVTVPVNTTAGNYTFNGTLEYYISEANYTANVTGDSQVQVVWMPVANFTADPVIGGAPFTVNFTDTSTGPPTSWYWDFGDGGNSTFQSLVYTYNNVGVYNVTLNVSNACDWNETTKVDYITVLLGVGISVQLEGTQRPVPAGWEVPLNVKFFGPGVNVVNGTPIYNFTVNTTYVAGNATCVCTNITPGSYNITARDIHTLINVRRNVTIGGPSTSVHLGTLLEGNADPILAEGYDVIDISDFGVLSTAYWTTPVDPKWNPMADFDRNEVVNAFDFNLLLVNYIKISPIEVT